MAIVHSACKGAPSCGVGARSDECLEIGSCWRVDKGTTCASAHVAAPPFPKGRAPSTGTEGPHGSSFCAASHWQLGASAEVDTAGNPTSSPGCRHMRRAPPRPDDLTSSQHRPSSSRADFAFKGEPIRCTRCPETPPDRCRANLPRLCINRSTRLSASSLQSSTLVATGASPFPCASHQHTRSLGVTATNGPQ